MMTQKEMTNILFKTQREFTDSQVRLAEVMAGMKSALEAINDTNVLHTGKESARYESIDKLAASIEAQSKSISTITFLLVLAVIVLAGAEKALQFFKVL